MSERMIVRVSLYDLNYRDDVIMTIPDAVAWLQEIEAEVPSEFKDSSVFKIEQEHDYYGDSSTLIVQAYYERPETDEEVRDRLARQASSEAAARAANEENERRIYEHLKRKFG